MYLFNVNFISATACTKPDKQINTELVKLVRDLIGPIAAFHLSTPVKALPRTRSGKIARKSIADLARNKFVKVNMFLHFHNF